MHDLQELMGCPMGLLWAGFLYGNIKHQTSNALPKTPCNRRPHQFGLPFIASVLGCKKVPKPQQCNTAMHLLPD